MRFITLSDRNVYRADPAYFRGGLASEDYEGADIKYFTLTENDASSYIKKGQYMKTWKINGELNLIDILDLETRNELYEMFDDDARKSLDIAFPIINGNVCRVSEDNTAADDYRVLRAICALPGNYDGYCMERQASGEGCMGFHSEIGLCARVLDRLELVSCISKGAPPLSKRARPSNNTGPPQKKPGALNFSNMGGGRKTRRRRRSTKKLIRSRRK